MKGVFDVFGVFATTSYAREHAIEKNKYRGERDKYIKYIKYTTRRIGTSPPGALPTPAGTATDVERLSFNCPSFRERSRWMHGCTDQHKMATGRGTDGAGSGGRRAECPNAGGCLFAGGSQHGAGVANPSESTTGQRKGPNTPPFNLGHLGPSGTGADRHEGEPGEAPRLASVGCRTGAGSAAIRSQEQTLLAGTPVSTGGVLDLLERQRYRCALSGRALTPQTAALDHIVPIRCGGEHVIENTQVLHKDVNRAKGSMTNDEFLAVCRQVVRWSAHSARNGKEHAHPE